MWSVFLISKDENFLPIIFHDLNSVVFLISLLKGKKKSEEETRSTFLLNFHEYLGIFKRSVDIQS